MERDASGREAAQASVRKRPWRAARKRPWRAAAHGTILLVVASLCVVVAVGGVFDDETPVVASATSATGAGDSAADEADATGQAAGVDQVDAADQADGVAATDDVATLADADLGPAEESGALPADATADLAGSAEPEPGCTEAGTAWAQSAKAQVDLSLDHPRALVTGFTTARDALASVEPPGAVAKDWGLVRDYVTMIADAVEDVGPDDPARLGKAIDRVGDGIETAALVAASERVTSYFRGGCVD